ncbi:MAG: hypothetical protein JO043_12105 [Candidatus Eremiobacteraeota bacterium]|nr:hypothetical protein [Candidatus Eremiobacteraeota bacterium]
MGPFSASFRALGSLVALSMLAACGGGQSPLVQSPAVPSGAAPPSTVLRVASDVGHDTCSGTGGVKVLPCHLKLKPSRKMNVTVSGPGYFSSTETDTCNGLVTFINQNMYGFWTVQAGTKAVKCKATFDAYNGSNQLIGHATLHVTVT